ncbi:MAG: hypothetical protein RTV31_15650 [Candidatus Thorarchaeota archaeon]
MNKMRKVHVLLGLSMAFLLIISQTSQVTAGNNQGLEWNVSVNDRFDYSIAATYHNATFDTVVDDAMWVNITELPTIPDNVTRLVQIAVLNFGTFWANGTSMHDFWWEIMHYTPFYLFPIGNWSLLESLWDLDVFQDATTFTVGGSSELHNATITVLKSDGALAHIKVEWIGPDSSLSFELIRDGYTVPTTTTTTTGDTTLLLMLGGGAAVAVVLIVIVVMRRR